MRNAIDKYKDMADANKLSTVDMGGVDAMGYPKTLQVLVDGIKGTGTTADVKVKFLRRIPLDPMTNSRDWGMHSMQDDPKSTGWGGQGTMSSRFLRKVWTRPRTGHLMLSGRTMLKKSGRRNGFTLIELMIVMAIIVILISVAIPFYQKSIVRAKESVLKSNLFAMRSAIDEYSYDKQKAPQQLSDLVSDGYLRDVPKDPITGNNDWKIIMEDASSSVDSTEPGIFDIRSESPKQSLEGTPYSEW